MYFTRIVVVVAHDGHFEIDTARQHIEEQIATYTGVFEVGAVSEGQWDIAPDAMMSMADIAKKLGSQHVVAEPIPAQTTARPPADLPGELARRLREGRRHDDPKEDKEGEKES